MNYLLLGNSGLRVSEICLGTMTFGEDWGWGASRDDARKLYEIFREAGGNFIDTANLYTNGASESLLGEFMAGHREEYDASRRGQSEATENRLYRSLLDAHLG
jgi:aryl-alcohol dehydrogenase-like predicted oxidoreductase